MKRRAFLKAIAVAAATSPIAAPALAQSMPELRWRMAVSWPKSLDTLYGSCKRFARRVGEITDNRFHIQLFAAGQIVPPFAILDAVQNDVVEVGNTAAFYYWGKDPSLAFGTAVPFGLNTRQVNAWLLDGGGAELLNELFAKFNCYGIAMGNTGAEMGGWFRKEVKTLDDVRGLKIRTAGLAGLVMSRLGAIPQQIAAPDIFPALEKGTIDAVNWIGPYDDEKLGFYRVAKYYYYPSWAKGSATGHTLINLARWHSLPKHYQDALKDAARDATEWVIARYDSMNPPALKRLITAGAQLRPFSQEILEAAYKAANEVYAEISKTNPQFKRLHDSVMAFRDQSYEWWQIAELSFDSFQIRMHH
jgi:TRAP-type mannitol/chloroaromatic compound transport system substrate-binding protein